MQDLNDLLYFAKVVEHGGFMAAGRILGIPKSRLSRRVAELEAKLGVRLLQRTTRRLALTEIGSQYYQHCQAMLAEAEAAHETILQSSAEPRGLIRVSCPELLSKTMLGDVLPRFLNRYPMVRVALDSTNRRVDLIEEGVDVAIRVRNVIEDSASLVVRRLGRSRMILVASPAFLQIHGEPMSPEKLAGLPALTMSRPDGRGQWVLLDNVGQVYTIHVDAPRLMTDDMIVLRQAAIDGVGIAALPANVCHQALQDGRLRRILPQYGFPWGILHAAFPSRRGLSPAVRAFLDFIAEELISEDAAADWGHPQA
ncbi:LysR substrate-binding domain-containing protein [Chromobacterium sp. IIBBL 290-4]|uniref:LysR substrate-binding domain-containing protein n=1 Tax=Chromobacterium sp. IIBBL 290-4 TaxID=2953890 RepID=UPI0020B73A5B|nr:LysR substrate-binding domain-containing protein [Chromobacterium sp. IIBBL 290-4]UTH73887.1 LysR substrate-binding domain-containing protein [Chromobacterium sp. IIBBL 290-4]